MSVAVKDISDFDGSPIMLYDFYRKSVPTLTRTLVETHWRFTSADRDFTIDGNTYTALAIGDDGIKQSGSAAVDQLSITMPYTSKIPQMFVGSPPSDPIYCVIRHANEGETDSFLVWAGIVGMVTRAASQGDAGSITATVVCNTIGATMDRTGLRLAWARSCVHDLYGFECKADPTLHYTTGVITALNGAIVIASAFTAPPSGGSFIGGFVEWIDADGHAERLGLIGFSQPDGAVRVLGTTDKLTVGQSILAFIGCDRQRATCKDVFNNAPNHGGHAYMPDTNPFSGDLIF